MDVPVCEKYTLTLREAAAYFSIGEKRRRRKFMEVLKNESDFIIKYYNSRRLIQKRKFEIYLSKHPEIRRRA